VSSGPGYYGQTYGAMKPFHLAGGLLHLSGHVPVRDARPLHPGRLGDTVTIEQGYQAARLAAVNAIAGMKQALGDLDRVAAIVKSLNFVVCTPDFHDVHKVSSGLSDLFVEVFGEAIGIGCRATIGVQALADNYCFETWITAEVR
jgi:enamine deaminase RidA (YjgF/YER057c/UK114 family)